MLKLSRGVQGSDQKIWKIYWYENQWNLLQAILVYLSCVHEVLRRSEVFLHLLFRNYQRCFLLKHADDETFEIAIESCD